MSQVSCCQTQPLCYLVSLPCGNQTLLASLSAWNSGAFWPDICLGTIVPFLERNTCFPLLRFPSSRSSRPSFRESLSFCLLGQPQAHWGILFPLRLQSCFFHLWRSTSPIVYFHPSFSPNEKLHSISCL